MVKVWFLQAWATQPLHNRAIFFFQVPPDVGLPEVSLGSTSPSNPPAPDDPSPMPSRAPLLEHSKKAPGAWGKRGGGVWGGKGCGLREGSTKCTRGVKRKIAASRISREHERNERSRSGGRRTDRNPHCCCCGCCHRLTLKERSEG